MKRKITLLLFALISLDDFSQAPNWVWAKQGTGHSIEEGISVATDVSGNVYATGFYIDSAITFGSVTLPASHNENIFLVKYNSNGNVIWAKGVMHGQAQSVAVDATGNIYVTGRYFGTIVF